MKKSSTLQGRKKSTLRGAIFILKNMKLFKTIFLAWYKKSDQQKKILRAGATSKKNILPAVEKIHTSKKKFITI